MGYACSLCGQEGHNKRTCSRQRLKQQGAPPAKAGDKGRLFSSLFTRTFIPPDSSSSSSNRDASMKKHRKLPLPLGRSIFKQVQLLDTSLSRGYQHCAVAMTLCCLAALPFLPSLLVATLHSSDRLHFDAHHSFEFDLQGCVRLLLHTFGLSLQDLELAFVVTLSAFGGLFLLDLLSGLLPTVIAWPRWLRSVCPLRRIPGRARRTKLIFSSSPIPLSPSTYPSNNVLPCSLSLFFLFLSNRNNLPCKFSRPYDWSCPKPG